MSYQRSDEEFNNADPSEVRVSLSNNNSLCVADIYQYPSSAG